MVFIVLLDLVQNMLGNLRPRPIRIGLLHLPHVVSEKVASAGVSLTGSMRNHSLGGLHILYFVALKSFLLIISVCIFIGPT